jgi:transglycosylase-like protein
LKSALQSAVALLSLMGGTIAAFILYYDVHDFRPYLPRIQAIYASMDPEDRNPPENVQDFVSKVEGPTYASVASRSLLVELRGPMRAGTWHYHSLMLELMLRWHFSKSQIVALYCHDLAYEGGSGFSKASNLYFGKQPDALDLDELATIVAVGRSPQWNSPKKHPDRLENTKKRLLADYEKTQ